MKILMSPQVPFNPTDKILYNFSKDVIRVTIKGKTDTFDFREFPDGHLSTDEIETILDINPIISAKRVDGELWIELINWIDIDSPEEERFPEWIDYTEYKKPGVNKNG